jgi:hypothetical protein
MKKLLSVMLIVLVLTVLSTTLVQSACTDINKDLGGAGYVYPSAGQQTGYVTQNPPPDDGTPDPIVDPIPTPDPDTESENQYTWRWNTNNDDAPEPGGKNK